MLWVGKIINTKQNTRLVDKHGNQHTQNYSFEENRYSIFTNSRHPIRNSFLTFFLYILYNVIKFAVEKLNQQLYRI